jgi:simple sugar transport system permease protein
MPPDGAGQDRRWRAVRRATRETVGTFLVIAAVAAVAIAAAGANPLEAGMAAIRQTFAGSYEIAGFVALSLPLMVAAFGVAVSFKAGLYNLGGEGQLALGAVAGAIVGLYVGPLWSPLHIAVVLVAGGLVGGLIATGLATLRVRFGVDEVVSTLLSNYILILLAEYLATYPFRDPTRFNGAMRQILPSAKIPNLVPGTELTFALFIVLALAAILYWVLHRSKLGYDWTLLGQSPIVAASSGLPVGRLAILAMAVSGFLAGVAGALMVSATQHRYFVGFGVGLGFNAILIGMIARNSIPLVVFWALTYAWLLIGADGVEQQTGIPSEIVQVIIAVVILGIAVRSGLAETLLARARRIFHGGRLPSLRAEVPSTADRGNAA